ncbi:hypothetical protein [Roseibium sp. MMSF_3412]|uniref:hypothetical protein n=1 Tax=Roseibium sp. MMSF_3412 TaxID=3046712 RepID=UPI00273E8C09|nr:hypothetical protein [Roseibium sp. MMSF_3412]
MPGSVTRWYRCRSSTRIASVVFFFLNEFDEEVETEKAGRRSLKNVAIVGKPGNPDENTSVWVRAGYSSYQNAWLGFVNQVYGLKATRKDLAGYNIDHLLNKARSPNKAGFIRIEAINDAVNQAWGACSNARPATLSFQPTRPGIAGPCPGSLLRNSWSRPLQEGRMIITELRDWPGFSPRMASLTTTRSRV